MMNYYTIKIPLPWSTLH